MGNELRLGRIYTFPKPLDAPFLLVYGSCPDCGWWCACPEGAIWPACPACGCPGERVKPQRWDGAELPEVDERGLTAEGMVLNPNLPHGDPRYENVPGGEPKGFVARFMEEREAIVEVAKARAPVRRRRLRLPWRRR